MADLVGIPLYNPIVPQAAFMKVKIGDFSYEGDTPNFLKSMTVTRILGGHSTVDISMSDVMDFELEQKIITSILSTDITPLSYQYGHYQGIVSPWYRGRLQNYIPQFKPNMNAVINITGYGDIALGKRTNAKYLLKNYDYRVSNLIRKLCEDEGWQIGEPFITSDKNTDITEVDNTGRTTLDFINYVLIPITQKDKNTTNFLYHCVSNGILVRLIEINHDNPKPSLAKKEFNFIINGGNYGNVLSFTPKYSGLANAGLGMNAGYVDRVTNQFTMFQNNPNIGGKMPMNTAYLGANSIGEFTTKIQSQWLDTNLSYAEADMEIVGDPDIMPMDNVNIIPIRPDGRPHHSAGTYMVMKVVDTVAGAYKTSLQLQKMPSGKNIPLTEAYESGWSQA